MSNVPRGWTGKWTAIRSVSADASRSARVFFSSGFWSLHRTAASVVLKSRHDSRVNAIRVARAWLRGET